MCFEREGDYNPVSNLEQKPLIGKDSDLEILRKTPKTREQINSIIEEKIAKLPKRDNGDKI
ncbi:MAG: hypothetical protein PHG82_02515 [Candidatus Gracilibacteria bacterium]|nr:hypothetical protein [Candidatus Gracilibacteria bacterium]